MVKGICSHCLNWQNSTCIEDIRLPKEEITGCSEYEEVNRLNWRKKL